MDKETIALIATFASLAVGLAALVAAWLWRKAHVSSEAHADRGAVAAGRDIRSPVTTGDEAAVADRGSTAVREMHGGTVIHIDNLNIYYDALPQAEPEVGDPFEEGLRLQEAEQHDAAIAEFEKAFAAAENDSQRCALHVLMGNSFLHLGRPTEAGGRYSEALQAAQRANDTEGQGAALSGLGCVYFHRCQPGDLDKAEQHHKEALAIHQQIGDKLGQAKDLGNLGLVYYQRGELDKAEEHHEKALAISRRIRNRLSEAQGLGNLGNVYFQRRQPGELDKAEQHHKKALAISRKIRNRLSEAQGLGNLGNVYLQRRHPGDLDKAEQHYKKALAIDDEIGNRLGQARQLGNLGVLEARRGHVPLALHHLSRARDLFAQLGARAELEKTIANIKALESASPPKPKRKRPRKKPPPKKP